MHVNESQGLHDTQHSLPLSKAEIRTVDYILQLSHNQPVKISKEYRIYADGMDNIIVDRDPCSV